MEKIVFVTIFAMFLTLGHGEEPSNYDLSRQVKKNSINGFDLREIWNYFIGAGYGSYPNYGGNYPNYGGNYPNYGGNYPNYGGQYPNYPSGPGGYPSGPGYPGDNIAGPPGAHPGCPLCDSSVYSYCSYKQAHDSCCCNSLYKPFACGNADCKFLYANSCQEFNLITKCCCVDLQKNAIEPLA